MADEIAANVSFRVNSTSSPFDYLFQLNGTYDQTGKGGGNPGTVVIGTSAEENIALGDISTEGWCVIQFVQSTATTDYVQLGVSATTPTLAVMMRISEGKPFAIFPCEPGLTIRAQANGNDVTLSVLVFED